MKKTNNKGFSLVELIIVIAIMAILAGAIAPALIRYIDKSRKSNDVSAAKTIKTAVETAMSNEVTYANLIAFSTNGTKHCIKLTAGGSAATAVVFNGTWTAAAGETTMAEAQEEIFKNLSESIPKIKYKKDAGLGITPDTWYVICSSTGQVTVVLAGSTAPTMSGNTVSGGYELVPNINKYYQ